ncbi:hypothetical protein SAMN02910275_01363 [Butyrivibrio sp. INlla18]|uniref:hypothetical protein n=1 Tax=Butyrivibrio sp. INlla18 TaxID=1520806 RepID=UPI00088145A3|nr:hypothetical protein [Butyrivibrio sp. INlla18]SDA57947.1 hypothetical protein SAMN02910275_01363 [Butyrivibrio sp. INlla18]
MDYKILYELTVRCTAHECSEDLTAYKIIDIDEEAVYTTDKKYIRSQLMEVDEIKIDKDGEEIILRVPFLKKESAIIWIREAFVIINEKGSRAMYAAALEEWRKIMHPYYDCSWFTGGQKVDEWRKEMKRIAERL